MKVAILLNAKAGQLEKTQCEDRAQEILAACSAADIQAVEYLCEPARLTSTARRLAHDGGIDAVVAAGGDGTVSAVAAGLVGSGVPLGVVPLGTLNHFAKDIGVRDVASAVRAIAARKTRRVDVGEVNGHVFINNSSIGVYPELVVERDSERREYGRNKWVAAARAALRVLLRFPLLHVAIAIAGRVTSARTPFVFVGNNEYGLGTAFGSRPRLDAGTLAVYTMTSTSRWKMFAAMVKALFRRRAPEVETARVARADIVATKRSLKVALDGEVRRLAPPLTYRCRPGALAVLGGEA